MDTDWPGEGRRAVAGKCPNVGNACNCVGLCHSTVVEKDDPRSDDQIRADVRAQRAALLKSFGYVSKPRPSPRA